MKPLRRKKTCQVTHDPITGKERVLEMNEEEDFLSDHGSVDSVGLHHKHFRDCGCDAPTGGRCYECAAISCQNCHGRCQRCQKPLCLSCSKFLETEANNCLRLCGRCYDIVSRKRSWSKVGRVIRSIFIEESPHG